MSWTLILTSASRWPIEEEKIQQFESTNKKTWSGYFVPKGINHARIKKTTEGTEKTYHIFNTHFGVSLMFKSFVCKNILLKDQKSYVSHVNNYLSYSIICPACMYWPVFLLPTYEGRRFCTGPWTQIPNRHTRPHYTSDRTHLTMQGLYRVYPSRQDRHHHTVIPFHKGHTLPHPTPWKWKILNQFEHVSIGSLCIMIRADGMHPVEYHLLQYLWLLGRDGVKLSSTCTWWI